MHAHLIGGTVLLFHSAAGRASGKWRNGRRARFRSVCPKGREGSTPSFPTRHSIVIAIILTLAVRLNRRRWVTTVMPSLILSATRRESPCSPPRLYSQDGPRQKPKRLEERRAPGSTAPSPLGGPRHPGPRGGSVGRREYP